MYKLMNSSFSIGNLQLVNRVVMPAMGVNLSAKGGGVSDDIIAFYETRARGGVGLIISEVTRVTDGAGAGEPNQLAARGLNDVPDLQRLADAVHKYNTKLFIQLQHPGMMGSEAVTGEKPVAPSVAAGQEDALHELSTHECDALVQAFITGALTAQMAGADGVELHGAHGYLINNFLSPATNRRSDKYGGSFENRMRFVSEIIKGIKKVCGARFPVSVRINAEEEMPGIPCGIDLEEAQKIALELERAGADVINVSCFSIGCIEPGTYEQGWKKHMAAAIKAVVKIPVIAVCNIKEPEAGEQLLNEGVCDLVGVGRGHMADPEWCNKSFGGRENEIRLCIGCLGCFGEISKLLRVKCAVNPLTGREREYAHPIKDGGGRTVAVIGGGPAGIEAALALKERGYAPVIFDERTRLGGSLNIADKGYGKTLITKYVDSLTTQVNRAGIEVRLGEKIEADGIRALNPCGVFLACGAVPFKPPVPGIDGCNVCTAEDVLIGKIKPEGAVAVIGSGMTGLETAEMLAEEGNALTMVEMLDSVGTGIYPTVVHDVMSRITPHNPQVLTGHRLERITPDKIILTRLTDGETVEVNTDWVVLAMGVRPRRDTADEFRKIFGGVIAVGDANRCGRILEATEDARGKAFVFNPK
ncbi:MAG: NAD(P)/FAD-dependent oxidoreductase [Defluviitaleaceae bacterium]|nr:NAD(P)/FAD-dependent oxidoreductase [Defluviitaleaceae bacterium]